MEFNLKERNQIAKIFRKNNKFQTFAKRQKNYC